MHAGHLGASLTTDRSRRKWHNGRVTCKACWDAGFQVPQTLRFCSECRTRKAAKMARRAARRTA
jgi:hypothetical protein